MTAGNELGDCRSLRSERPLTMADALVMVGALCCGLAIYVWLSAHPRLRDSLRGGHQVARETWTSPLWVVDGLRLLACLLLAFGAGTLAVRLRRPRRLFG